MKVLFHASILLVLFLLGSSLAYACSCADQSQRQRFRSSDAVFVGEVLEYKDLSEAEYKRLTENDPDKVFELFIYRVTFKVEKQWKGERRSQLTALASYDNPGWCGDLDLSVGKRVLVYAPREHGQLLVYRDCGPNRSAEYAQDEIKKMSSLFFRVFAYFYPYPKF